ncbi:MAG: hypothetical protein HQL24_01865 [Candidatus Omnitrophica bacterium]|nr:hypothetical protein [Candidatus Omnitrophota bacterium]
MIENRRFRNILSVALILLATIYLYNQSLKIINEETASIITRTLISLKGNYENVRNDYFINRIGTSAKRLIPAESKIQTSFPTKTMSFESVSLKYNLYPLKIEDESANIYTPTNTAKFSRDNWDYFIDFHQMIHNSSKQFKELPLGNGVRLFAQEGHNFLSSKESPSSYPLQKNIIIFFLITAFISLIGFFMLTSFGILPQKTDKFWLWGTSYLLGFVFLNFLVWIFLLIGGTLTKQTVIGLWGLSGIIFFLRRKRQTAPFCLEEKGGGNGAAPKSFFGESLAHFFYAALLIVIFLKTISIPISVVDEMWIWLLKAKIFFYQGHLDFQYTSNANNYYPLLWPIHNAVQFLFLNGAYDEAAKWTSAIIFLCFIAQIKKILSFWNFKPVISKILICVYLLVFFQWIFLTALPENLYLALLMTAAGFLLNWINLKEKDDRLLTLAFFMFLGLSGVKFEGAVIAFFCFLSLFLSCRQEVAPKKLLMLGVSFGAIFLIPLGWLLWLHNNGVSTYIFHLQKHFSTENILIMLNMVWTFLTPSSIIPIILGVAFMLSSNQQKQWEKQDTFLFSMMTLLILFSLTAGINWPSQDLKLYYPEVLSRLFLRATPFIMLFWTHRVFHKNHQN